MEKVDTQPDDLPAEAPHRIQLPRAWQGQRLDRAVARLFGGHSRGEIQEWIGAGRVLLEGDRAPAKTRIRGGEWIRVAPPGRAAVNRGWRPAPVPLEVVHADDDILVIAKPAGLVVHPAPGHVADTLVNGLLHAYPELADVERAGIVHRLDRDTSGLLVVARSARIRDLLVKQFKRRAIDRCYLAVVRGELTSGGRIEAPIARHPRHRTRFAVVEGGKPAVTHYRVRERFRGATLIEARLETGRTHQVRIHMAHTGHPVLGDPLYGGKGWMPPGLDEAGRALIQGFRRQALHAGRLGLVHPGSGEECRWEMAPPEDMQRVMDALREAAG